MTDTITTDEYECLIINILFSSLIQGAAFCWKIIKFLEKHVCFSSFKIIYSNKKLLNTLVYLKIRRVSLQKCKLN